MAGGAAPQIALLPHHHNNSNTNPQIRARLTQHKERKISLPTSAIHIQAKEPVNP